MAKVKTEPKPASSIPVIPPERLADERWYVKQLATVAAQLKAGEITGLAATQQSKFFTGLYKDMTGQDLAEAARSLRSPLERLEDTRLLELNEAEIAEVEVAIDRIPKLDPGKKARWLALLGRAKALQRRAKQSAQAMWVYVGRDSEDGSVFRMDEVHNRYFQVWADPTCQHSLIEAPPGHAKTTSMRGQRVWDVAQDQSLRCLILLDSEDKAGKEIDVLKRIFRSGRFRGLYPHIRVLGRNEDAEDSRKRFTVTRPNMFSREPTFEAAGVGSQINGSGYDVIYIDDPCPESVSREPAVRKAINEAFENVVEQRFRSPERAMFRVIGTPWHPEDLLGMIVSQVRTGKRAGWKVAIDEFAIKEDQKGDPIPLWPRRYDKDHYIALRNRMTPANWARLYRLECLPESERVVSRLVYYPADPTGVDWRYLPAALRDKYLARIHQIRTAEQWLTVDPAATSGRHSSEVAVVQIALTAQGLAYVVDCWFLPGNPVAVQQWLVAAASGGIWPEDAPNDERKSWPLPHKVDRVLFEAQGGMTGQVTLWADYMRRELRRMGSNFVGKLYQTGTRTKTGSQQNIGKRIRLRNVASFLETGFLKFPGTLHWNPNIKQAQIEGSQKPNLAKLAAQVLEFPTRVDDGVDCITQWIKENESRLVADKDVQEAANELHAKSGRARAVSDLFRKMHAGPQPVDEIAKEMQWLMQRSVA